MNSFRQYSSLTQIEFALDAIDTQFAHVSPEEFDAPMEQIVVFGIQNDTGDDYPLRMYYLHDLLYGQTQAGVVPHEDTDPEILVMRIQFPFEPNETDLYQLSPVIAYLNTILPEITLYGSLEGLFLEHKYVHAPQKPDFKVIVEMMDRIQYFFIQLISNYESYFSNQLNAQELLQQILKNTKASEV